MQLDVNAALPRASREDGEWLPVVDNHGGPDEDAACFACFEIPLPGEMGREGQCTRAIH